jgi:hypothetical protein
VVRVVRDEDDAQPAVARLRDVAQHDAGLLDAERRRRLVEDQHLARRSSTARAIATAWRSPPDSVPTGWSGSRTSMPILRSSSVHRLLRD